MATVRGRPTANAMMSAMSCAWMGHRCIHLLDGLLHARIGDVARQLGVDRSGLDHDLSDLVGELSTRSDPFRLWWAAHDVRYHQTGTKRLRHPLVGDLELNYEVMPIPGDGLRLTIFTAEIGSRSAHALDLLSSWSATALVDVARPGGVATARDQDAS
jgi:hypothetical protein